MHKILLIVLFYSVSPVLADCVSEVVDLEGSEWRTERTRPILERLKPHSDPGKRRITIHYTGVKKNPNRSIEQKLTALFRFSTKEKTEFKKNLWGDVPYHYYIDFEGKLAESRSTQFQPDTNTRYDPDGHITIVVEGDETDILSDEQKAKLFQLVEKLQDKYKTATSQIGIHKHFANTSCPGRDVETAMKEYVRIKKDYKPKDCAT